MPLYDYGCKGCDVEFSEMSKIDDRFVPCWSPCLECGGEITLLIGAPALVDSVVLGIDRPDNTYSEVISKINEESNLNGTRYQLEDRLESREQLSEKGTSEITKHEIKVRVNDKLKAKKGRGK